MYAIIDDLGPAAKELLAAWMLLPKHECVPDRQSFDPMTVARILPVTTLLQRVGDEEWRFRLVGTEVDKRWGRPLTGLNCIEIASPEASAIIRREFDGVVRQPCGSWSVRRVKLASGRYTTVETLRLPLRAKDGSVNLILGSSGELAEQTAYTIDRPSSIVMIEQQRFFDIGAGVPASVLSDGVGGSTELGFAA